MVFVKYSIFYNFSYMVKFGEICMEILFIKYGGIKLLERKKIIFYKF